MPINKKESLIFTIMMCFFMVYFMTVYNLSFYSPLDMTIFKAAWAELPIAMLVAFILDWFIVGSFAKKLALKLIKPESSMMTKIFFISFFMVIGMVIFMSLFGTFMHKPADVNFFIVWGQNIAKNFIVALPLQLFVAGPIVRLIFRAVFPIGTINDASSPSKS